MAGILCTIKQLVIAGLKTIFSEMIKGELYISNEEKVKEEMCIDNVYKIKEEMTDDDKTNPVEIMFTDSCQYESESNSRKSRHRRSSSRERRGRTHNRRNRSRSENRSFSRRYQRSVSFQERKGGKIRRDAASGISIVNVLNVSYDRIYKNDDFFQKPKVLGQFIIVDSGCPRSLMGDQEYKILKRNFRTEQKDLKRNERFRFGPSRVYESEFKAKLFMRLGSTDINVEFFVVKGSIPILLGNDVIKPLEGSINLSMNKLELKKVNKSIDMIETSGGHYVIPIKSVAVPRHSEDKTNKEDEGEHDNLKGEEADEVMLILLAESENHKDVENVHKEIGHTAFVGLALTLEEESQVNKVHKYFGHRSGRRVWELFAKADKLKRKKPEVLKVIENCEICSKMKKAPPRPKVGLPVANDFNEVVGMDLKVVDKNKGEYILWMVDLFSKLIKGKFIKDKNPSTIIQGIIETWIIGGGIGPGNPTRGFWTDNGGEFLNEEMINFAAAMDIDVKMTSAEAPWQNGVVERHHASADIIFEKMMKENPGMPPQEAINHASFARNSEINQTRFSALQLMMGQTPHFPGLAEANPASSNLKSSNKYFKTLKNIDDARVMFRQVDCDSKLKKVMGQKINPNVERAYKIGDPVLFYDMKKKEWRKGTALVRLGKTVYLRYGNYLRRVAVEKVRPDYHGEVKVEEGYLEKDEDDERFAEEETPVVELAADLAMADENTELKKKVRDLEEVVTDLRHANKMESEKQENTIEPENNAKELEKNEVSEGRKQKRKLQKEKKRKDLDRFPKLGQQILFKEKGTNSWKKGRIVKTFKKTGKYKHWRHIDITDEGRIEVDFENAIEEWKESEDNDDSDHRDEEVLEDIEQVFPVHTIPKSEFNRPDVQEAMEAEIAKFEDFKAFREVADEGQKSIPIRWVVTEKKQDGKNQPLKARLCMRGDLEKGKDKIRADSPTASKEALKLALIIAANEGFEVKSADIKSAFLQGKRVEREIFVKPPPEAKADGKLWLLLQGAYGILDGGRLFYLRLAEELQGLGLHKVHSEGALFTYVKNGKLQGLVATHVDDLILAGNDIFEKEVTEKLMRILKFSKIEKKSFKYCGCHIVANDDGSVELDQNEYVDALEKIETMEGDPDRKLSEKETKAIRAKVGELLWVSLMTRPDLSYDLNVLSGEVSKATVNTAKELNKLVTKAKGSRNVLKFCKLGNIENLVVKVYADASYGNQDDGVRSTAGRVVLLEHKHKDAVNVVSWKTKKISRVCRSVKTAETRALEEAIDEAVNTARLIKEIYSGKVNLKNPEQIPVMAVTDCKSLWESLHNTKQC